MENIPANLLTPRRCSRLDMFDVRSEMVVDCGSFSLKVIASNIFDDNFGCGVFSGRLFGAGEIVGYYNETLVYAKCTTQTQVQNCIFVVSCPSLKTILIEVHG